MQEGIGGSGFTLVELSLSLAFIGVLSIAVVLVITNTISTYHRGLVLNEINTVGMDLVSDIRSAVQASRGSGWGDENAPVVKGDVEDVDDVPLYGAFCTGKYSYLWQSRKFTSEIKYEYRKDATNYIDPIKIDNRLLKIDDESHQVCKAFYDGSVMRSSTSVNPLRFDMEINSGKEDEKITELLNGKGLTVYDFKVDEASNRSGILYTISFVLGTKSSGNINSVSKECSESGRFDNYCAINEFNFAAQAVGG